MDFKKEDESRLEGSPVSDGIAIGSPFFLSIPDLDYSPEFPITVGEIDREISRYRKALFSSREDLQQLQTHLENQGSLEAVTIIDTHLQMLEDPMMTTHVEERIRLMQRNTEAVFRSVIKEVEKKFSKVEDSFFRERFVDVKDLSKRILNHLCPEPVKSFAEIPPNSIVFSKELAPSYTAALQAHQVAAFVTELGGGNSHAALIARAKGVPYVASIDIEDVIAKKPERVIVDGSLGHVILNPLPSTILFYEEKRSKFNTHYQHLESDARLKAETPDGHAVTILANISSLSEVEFLHMQGAAGIGLFRSEYLFLHHPFLFEAEEEQYLTYRQLAERAGGMPVVIRVMDLGGDKSHALSGLQKESNPVLGCRGIRLLLRCTEIFKTQLRAILRATPYGDIRILLPLISDIEELRKSKEILEEVKRELRAKGTTFNEKLSVGCMVEVPSAVLICDSLAEECDFLSMGTNDLMQYTLGVDRSNPLMSDFCFPAHPSIIRMIKHTAEEAKKKGKRVAVCGEIASNPLFIPLLLGLGIDEISCAPRYIPFVKKAVRSCPLKKAKALAKIALGLKTSSEISALLTKNVALIGQSLFADSTL
ncbi:MAG: phosphoenolpyruvate--protein phosphotransferase [Chlamydiales bacterium]|nr:phosphoenolpyruvate--protein phosphotransferase [Chlamydiales bacterium]